MEEIREHRNIEEDDENSKTVHKIVLTLLFLASVLMFITFVYGAYKFAKRGEDRENLKELKRQVYMNEQWYLSQREKVENLEKRIAVFKQAHELENFFEMLLSTEQMADLKDLEKHIERYKYEKELKNDE